MPEYSSEWINFLNKNPVVSAAGLSSFLTFLGIMLSQWVNSRHLNAKFRHEREERKQEHQAEIRKEVYFGAIEALVTSAQIVQNIPNTEANGFTQLDKDISAKFIKLHLIASFETIKIFKKAESLLSIKFTEMSGLFFDMHTNRLESKNAQAMIDLYGKKISDVLAQMKEYNAEKRVDKEIWDSLQSQFEDLQKEQSIETEKKLIHDMRASQTQFDLAKLSASGDPIFNDTISTAILRLRSDMGMPLAEEAEYMQMIRDCAAIQGDLAKRIFADISGRLESLKGEGEALKNRPKGSE